MTERGSFRGGLVDGLYAAGWAVVRGMPEPLARSQFDAIADAIWTRHGRSVQRLEANLRRVVGPDLDERQLRRLTRRAVRSYLRYWREVFQLPRMSVDQILSRVRTEGEADMRAAVASGRGVVFTLPHMGNWDLAGAWLAASGTPFTTVAERLEPASLFERFVEFRESLGMEVVPLTGGERPPFELLADRLRAGGTLALLGDRDLTATGLEVELFGAPARVPAGPAALAVDTGAALIPATLRYSSARELTIRFHPEVVPPSDGPRADRIATTTQRAVDAFAAGIAAAPEDWHMLQRVWVADLDASRLSATVKV